MKTSAIAIVGMAGRFPGARNLAEFWRNLRDGVESIRDRSDAELIAAGASQEELTNADYVRRAAILDDVPMFDASFFGLSPRDASIMDPQHRHFLECAWEALEDAGHPPQRFEGSIGVFAGSGMNSYLIHNLLANRKLLESAGLFQLKQTGNDKDVLATRVSYQLDLRGPSINVQTACSTSLVAVHLACQSLLNQECDMALAGGVTIEIPHGRGYVYREGEILSRDGHCRAFDASSSGTVFGSGLGIVALRRLDDAVEDGDSIHAVILGSAINNDGARKVGYLAPSVEGQAEVIAEALEFAGVKADEISYVETHGTGTVVGDPIEVRALTQAFRRSTTRTGFCGFGSLKTNIGHLDAAAGVAGLIKTVLALEHRQVPPSLHFKKLNPHIELKESPLFVNERLSGWPPTESPRRAGVTSLGIGGTNAHVVLEEAPRVRIERQAKPFELLTVSAKTEAAADAAVSRLVTHIHEHPELSLCDVAFTCQIGRHAFAHRRALVVENTIEAIAGFASAPPSPDVSGVAARSAPGIVFMFSGQGSQYVNMGREGYRHEKIFRETLDTCAAQLQQYLGIDLLQAMYPAEDGDHSAAAKLDETWLTQPALFSIEYALACWWMSLGVQPTAMVGHSIGEYVAACLAGVMSLEDALAMVAYRGRLIFGMPCGSMLAVPLAPGELRLDGSLTVAAINNPRASVVSGPTPEIAALEEKLTKQSVASRRLHTSHAFHSKMMDPILGTFEERMRGIRLSAPKIPYLSNVSGTWIKADEATDPAYWARHIRQTVRFSDALAELMRKPEQVYLEVGPSNALSSLARQQGGVSTRACQSLPHPRETGSDFRFALRTLGQLWVWGVEPDWPKLHAPGSTQRVCLPTYPFEHQKYWVEPDRTRPVFAASPVSAPAEQPWSENPTADWFYRRAWKADLRSPATSESTYWMIFCDALGLGEGIASQLESAKHAVIRVEAGSRFNKTGGSRYTIRPDAREDYDALLETIASDGKRPKRIIHLWSVIDERMEDALDVTLNRSFYSPLYLAQALGARDLSDIEIGFVSNGLQQVDNETTHHPARAVLLGPALVIPKELPGIRCRPIDVDFESGRKGECASQIIAEMNLRRSDDTVAYRGGRRFVEIVEHMRLPDMPGRQKVLRGGAYLITGGLGGLGLAVAEYLAREYGARLVLVSRSAVQPEAEWRTLLQDSRLSEEESKKLQKLSTIRSKAGGLLVLQADVTNLPQMRDAITTARKLFGKIDGVFHAAGIVDDGPLMLKTAEAASRVLDPKVRGTLVLEEALGNERPGFFVLFSSISSLKPPAGQVDYAAANAFLDAFAASRKGPVIAVNWGPWREVGMAARIDPSRPMLKERLVEIPGEIVFRGHVSIEKDWVLSDHRLKNGTALLPGTGYLELAAEAFSRGNSHGAIELSDVFFLSPLSIDETDSRELRIQVESAGQSNGEKGLFAFSVFARNGNWVEHASGRIRSRAGLPLNRIDRAAIAARCVRREFLFDESHRTKQEQYFNFGPRWLALKKISIGEGEALAELALPEKFVVETSAFRMHPALLDMATGCALYITDKYEDFNDLYLPFSYKKICLYRTIPARLFSHIRSRQGNVARGEIESFDITLADEGGGIVAEIEGFAMRRISDPARAADEKQLESTSAGPRGARPIECAECRGIPPMEGVRALDRILFAEIPGSVTSGSVVVSAEPLEPRVDERREIAASQKRASGQNESVEKTVAGWFEELLGVERVGLDDDFFSLGGHSLIAVRLFAKIKTTYRVDLELASIFESRTVRLLAEAIRKAQKPAAPDERIWSCIVPIQTKGTQVPFFFVHAVGGEVLFYEPLSQALGSNQPFYAFRSLLTTREDIQSTSIEELAAAYVREMRALYPQGPYLIGGHSYGGLVSLEMAHQLSADGVAPELVIMFDAVVPGSRKRVARSTQLSTLFQNLRNEGVRYLVRKAGLKRLVMQQRMIHRFKRAAILAYRLFGCHLPMSLRYTLIDDAHGRAMERYTFKPYPGKIILIRAGERGYRGVLSLSERDDFALGWESIALGGVEIHDVDADHLNMMVEPKVRIVAGEVKAILAALETTSHQRTPVVQE